ncbi:MAG: Sua5/YciO/YrdC/YwlC family protein, partial [Bacteroidota bacterium]
NLWQVISNFRSPETLNRHLSVCPPTQVNRPELLFADLDQLHQWVPTLHPKIDSLLLYHRRACTILLPRPARIPALLADANNRVAVRLIMDSFCYQLSEGMDAPLLATLAIPRGARQIPVSFGKLRSDLLRDVDYVVQRRQRDQLGNGPAVRLYLNESEEIEFL